LSWFVVQKADSQTAILQVLHTADTELFNILCCSWCLLCMVFICWSLYKHMCNFVIQM